MKKVLHQFLIQLDPTQQQVLGIIQLCQNFMQHIQLYAVWVSKDQVLDGFCRKNTKPGELELSLNQQESNLSTKNLDFSWFTQTWPNTTNVDSTKWD